MLPQEGMSDTYKIGKEGPRADTLLPLSRVTNKLSLSQEDHLH